MKVVQFRQSAALDDLSRQRRVCSWTVQRSVAMEQQLTPFLPHLVAQNPSEEANV